MSLRPFGRLSPTQKEGIKLDFSGKIFTSIIVSFLVLKARQLVQTSLSKFVVTTTKTTTSTSKNISAGAFTWTISSSQPTPWRKCYNFLLIYKNYSPPGSLNLTKWITTNSEVLSAIPQQHRAISHNELNDPKTRKRMLGDEWNISSDSVVFQLKKIQDLKR